MQTPLQRNLSNGLQDFPGLTISGTIPLKQEFLNELLADIIQTATAPKAQVPAVAASGNSTGNLDKLASLVKTCKLQADPGVITLKFEIRR